jgi:hypothetical protein
VAERELAAAKARLAGLDASQVGVLLDGTQADAEALEGSLAACRRDIRRLEIQIQGLAARHAQTVARERQQVVERQLAAARRRRDEGVAIIQRYVKTAAALAEDLRELIKIDGEIRAAMTAARAAGRQAEDLGYPDAIARPGAHRPLHAVAVLPGVDDRPIFIGVEAQPSIGAARVAGPAV